ncbi:MAG: hypothetical protein ACAH59_01805 [Pseudobdellovibrionaceae bacterium]
MNDLLICPHSDICSVCTWMELSTADQKERKLAALQEALETAGISLPPSIRFHLPGPSGIRDRLDLTYEQGRYGFYRKDRKEIFSIEACPLMSKGLFSFFKEVQKVHLPIRRGSLRLRISPQGERGLWLDFANEDVRDLLASKKELQAFLDLGFVEIGQRRKKLTAAMKLTDPEFHTWTRTWVQGKEIELFSCVGSFSQTGDLANQSLISELEAFLASTSCQNWVEFGSGSGNLTFPLAGENRSVKALEFDSLALNGLQQTLQRELRFRDRIEISQGDYQRKAVFQFRSDEGVLVNPPRSGLQGFLNPLKELNAVSLPKDFLYMSCYLESFVQDARQLKDLGYKLFQISIIDQFPHSPHFEILSHWQLSALS